MTEKRIIAVVGATGTQGGGLARAILADPGGPFTVRALTRDVDSPRARALAEQGAEVVRADLDDEASVQRAFAGAYGAFVVTNFWASLTPEQEAARSRSQMETDQAYTAARAAKDNGLKHVVWSTLDDSRPHFSHLGRQVPVLEDGYAVPHFDAKAQANTAFTSLAVPTTFLLTTMFYESFLQGQGPIRDADGNLVLAMPMSTNQIALVRGEDIGRGALGVLKRGAEFVGRTVGVAGEHLTGEELAGEFTKLFGEQVAYKPMSYDDMRSAGFPIAAEVGNMYEFYSEASAYFTGIRPLDLLRDLNPGVQSLDRWLAEHRDALIATV
jgi:uncharacterized protein YbjT (DUF2867 family)